ncbi:MAG: type II toxin-antitoxin system VapB family antitoxin [Acidobacteriota bacterium]
MTITVDDRLVAKVKEALGTRTKAQTIRLALREVLRRNQLVDALAHEGRVELKLDQKTLQKLRADR